MSTEVQKKVDEGVQVHDLYGDVAVLSHRDQIGRYIDQGLEVFRSDGTVASFLIEVLPSSSILGNLRTVSEMRGIQYLINDKTGERFAGLKHVYWSFDELGRDSIRLYYGSKASADGVWLVLEQWIKIAFMQKKWVPVHSAAFIFRDVPVVVVGWQDMGKSRLLHYALDHGAAYVSDDFAWISGAGNLRGHPEAKVSIDLSRYSGSRRREVVSSWRSLGISIANAAERFPRMPVILKDIARKLGRNHPYRVRMDSLHPGMQTVTQTSAALWIVILPGGARQVPINTNVTPGEALERVVTSTLTDYYFTQYYDRYLYQCGQRAEQDYLILNARAMHRDLMGEALRHAKAIWIVDSSTVLLEPGTLLQHIADVRA